MAEVSHTHVTGEKHLFLDDGIIEELVDARQVLNQPRKFPGNPVLKPEGGWEFFHGTSVIYDEEDRLFKMWHGVQKGQKMESGSLGYATSEDGVHWERPKLGLFEWGGTKDNNVVFPPLMWATYGVIKDVHDADPARRYKALFHFCTEDMASMGYYQPVCAAYSPDGIHWDPRLHRNPVIWSGTDVVGFGFWWDPEYRRYRVMLRGSPTENRRDVWQIAESEDFIDWGERSTVLTSDENAPPQNRNLYDMKVGRYADMYMGTMSMYHVLHERWSAYHAVKPDAPSWMQKTDIQLLHSRDAKHWHWTGDQQVFLPYGSEGSWDQGMLYATNPPFITVGDEIWMYYLGTTRLHGRSPRTYPDVSVGLAKLRRDGFASVDADEKEGILVTKPLTYGGNRLAINVDARQGHIRVEIVDPFDGAIPGFSREACDPFSGDAIRHTVTWQGESNIGALMQPGSEGFGGIKLKIYLKRAKLYSVEFFEQ